MNKYEQKRVMDNSCAHAGLMKRVVGLISGLVAIMKFISFHAQECFNNGLDESPVAWQPPAVNMQPVLPWEQDDWWEDWDV